MALFAREPEDPDFERGDRGRGSFDDYVYDLLPKNKRVRIELAGSAERQDALREARDLGDQLETAVSARTLQQEGTDDRIHVRLFSGRRVTPEVGLVPRGLEAVVDETLRRLDNAGKPVRIPVQIVERAGRLRAVLLMGATR